MTNKSLIDKIRLGDSKILEEIYRKYRGEFITWGTNKFGLSTEDASEIFQLSVIQLYENVVEGYLSDLRSSLKTYLFAIGKNKILGFLKDKKSFDREYDFELHPEVYISDSEKSQIEEDIIELEKGLAELGEPCTTILTLFYFNRLKLEQIQEQLGYKKVDTVKSQKYKCTQRLKRLLQVKLN